MDLLHANDRDNAYPDSYYTTTVSLPEARPSAHGPLHTDVCIIGGGYTGLSAALHLAELGYDVIVLEAHRIGFGASGRNGGQAAAHNRLDQSTLERLFGAATAHALWEAACNARDLLDTLIVAGIDCDLRDGIIYTTTRAQDVAGYHAEARKMETDYGTDQFVPLDEAETARLVGTRHYTGGVLDRASAHLNPLKLALGLGRLAQQKGAQIFEGSEVRSIADDGPHVVIRTDEATISADHVILATNGYSGRLSQDVAAHVMPINSYMIATDPLDPETLGLLRGGHAVADNRFVVNYFRLSPDNRLLFGGGESYRYKFANNIAAKVRAPMEAVFPQLRGVGIAHSWGGTLAITRSRMPYFSRPSSRAMSAAGFSGQGVTMTLLAGKAMAEAIDGDPTTFNLFADLPSKAFPGGARLRSPLLFGAMTLAALSDRLRT